MTCYPSEAEILTAIVNISVKGEGSTLFNLMKNYLDYPCHVGLIPGSCAVWKELIEELAGR